MSFECKLCGTTDPARFHAPTNKSKCNRCRNMPAGQQREMEQDRLFRKAMKMMIPNLDSPKSFFR